MTVRATAKQLVKDAQFIFYFVAQALDDRAQQVLTSTPYYDEHLPLDNSHGRSLDLSLLAGQQSLALLYGVADGGARQQR